jgi:hypothetical protein
VSAQDYPSVEMELWEDLPEEDAEWTRHWVGMPEFVQPPKKPFAMIIVRVETEDDLKDLADRLGQRLTKKTKSIWHPYRPHALPVKKVWRSAE